MEELYLAADRYGVDELKDLLQNPLLRSLDSVNAIPLLFRFAFKFEEIREPVIQLVAKLFSSEIIQKDIRGTYHDHPDLLDIVMDLFEAYLELHPQWSWARAGTRCNLASYDFSGTSDSDFAGGD